MGNLASCAGAGRTDYRVDKPRRPAKRSESAPAKPLSLGRLGSMRKRRPDGRLPSADAAAVEGDGGGENSQVDPLLQKLMELKVQLQASAPQPQQNPEASAAAAAEAATEAAIDSRRKQTLFQRRLSCMAPIRRNTLLATPAPTLNTDTAAVVVDDDEVPVFADENGAERDPSDCELAEIMEKLVQQQQQQQLGASNPPPKKPPPPLSKMPPKKPPPLGARTVRTSRSAPSTPPMQRSNPAAPRTPPPKPPRYANLRLPGCLQPPPRPPELLKPLPRPPLNSDASPAEHQERPNTPDSLDGGDAAAELPEICVPEDGVEPIGDQEQVDENFPGEEQPQSLPLQLPHQQQQLLQKESTRPASKSVCDLVDSALMDSSVYENVDWDNHLAVLRPTCFGSAMCHMDHLTKAASQDLLQPASSPADTAAEDTGQLSLPLTSRSRAARQILSRAFVQCLPFGGEFLRLCRARGCLSESATRELLRGLPPAGSESAPMTESANSSTARAERFLQLFDWSETSLRKLSQCLTATGGAFNCQLAAIVTFLSDLFALLAARHLFVQQGRAGKRRRVDAFLRGVRLIDGNVEREEEREGRCQVQLLYLANSDDQGASAEVATDPQPGRRQRRHQLTASEVAAINEPDWLCSNFTPALSLDLTGSGVNAWFFKQLVGKSLQPVAELSLAGCELDSGLLPTLVLTQRSSQLRVLCLAGASLGDDSLSALCLLPQHQLANLEVLDLSACDVTHFGLSLLAGCIPVTLPRLSDLDLSWNDLSEAAPATMAGLLDPAAGLRGLRLRGCRLASDALRAVADGLPAAIGANLCLLDLSDNRLNCLILTRLAERLGKRSATSGRLSELGLAGVNLFAIDLQKLLESGGCDGCRRLDLGRNHLGEAGAVHLAGRLPPQLDSLAVASCRLGCRGLRRLLESAKLSSCLRLVRATNNLRNQQGRGGGGGGLGAEETALRREIVEANLATGGRLRFMIDDAADCDLTADCGAQSPLSDGDKRLRRGGSFRRSLRRLASLD